MDLHHETSRWKGIQISAGRVRPLNTRVNRRKIIRCAWYQTDSPEVSLAHPLFAINLSLCCLSPFFLLCHQVTQRLESSYMASPQRISNDIQPLSLSVSDTVTTCQSHLMPAGRWTQAQNIRSKLKHPALEIRKIRQEGYSSGHIKGHMHLQYCGAIQCQRCAAETQW